MTDNATLMVDLSSNNGPVDLAKHYAAGYRVIALKATEGTSYTWADHGKLADQWHKLGGQVWHYHFARPGLADQQTARFLSAVAGHWADGDRLVLDAEVTGVNVPFVAAFISCCHAAHPDRPGVIYSYASFLTSAKIKPSHGWELWLADYTAKTTPEPPAGWGRLTAWQYTNKATVPGVAGTVDQSHLYDVAAHPTPLPKPVSAALTIITRHLRRRVKTGKHPITAHTTARFAALDDLVKQARNIR